MPWTKYAAGAGAIACLLTSTAAFATDATRSASAVPAPTAQHATVAPTNGVRTSTKLKKKSNAIGGSGAIIAGALATAIVIGGIVVATDDDNEPDSPG